MKEQIKRLPIMRKILAFGLIFALAVAILPGGISQPLEAQAATSSYDFSTTPAPLFIPAGSPGDEWHIYGSYISSTAHAIEVASGFDGIIYLHNVNIQTQGTTYAAMLIGQSGSSITTAAATFTTLDTKVELVLDGTNTLYTGNDTNNSVRAGLEVWKGAQVHIRAINEANNASGVLTARACVDNAPYNGSTINGSGAGIGAGNVAGSGGNVVISSGTIHARAAAHGAAIGGAWTTAEGYKGTILVYGGIINCGGGDHGYGIGCGCSTTGASGTIVFMPPAQIGTITYGSTKGALGGLSGGMLYFGDSTQPAITVKTVDNRVNAAMYADLSNIALLANAVIRTGVTGVNTTEVFLGDTDGTGALTINATLTQPVTFFTNVKTPNGLNYLSYTKTPPIPTGTIITLPIPYFPGIPTGAAPSTPLLVNYSSATAGTSASSVTLSNTGSYDLKIGTNVDFSFVGTDFGDPAITFTDGTPATTLSAMLTAIGGGGTTYYIRAGQSITLSFPLATGKVVGSYSGVFTITGDDETYAAQPGNFGQTRVETFGVTQNVFDYGVSSVTASPNQLTSSGGSVTITLEGTDLHEAINDGLYLYWTDNGGGTGRIRFNTGGTATILSGSHVSGGTYTLTPANDEIALTLTLDPQQWYEANRDDGYTFEAYYTDTSGGSVIRPTGLSDTVYVGDSVPHYDSASANPANLPNIGGSSVITVHGSYLGNYSSIDIYDVVNNLWYYNISASGDDRTSTQAVLLPALEGAYGFEIWISDESTTTPVDTVYIAVGGAALPPPGTPATPPGTLPGVPAPTDPSDKEWTGRGVGHKGIGFTGDKSSFDFLYHHAKQAYLASPGSGVVTLQNVWFIAETQLKGALSGANDGSGWTRGTVDLHFDTLALNNPNVLEGRMIISSGDIAVGIYPVVCTCPNETAHTKNLFAGRYQSNRLAVIALAQNGLYATEADQVEIVANIDLSAMNGKTLYLYRYDPKTGEYSYMKDANYSIDSSGLFHFFTRYGGDIIITDAPLTENGVAIASGSFPVGNKSDDDK